MLDRDIQLRMKNEGATKEEMEAHFEKCAKFFPSYEYGKKNGPSREFMFDAMSFRAWVYALTRVYQKGEDFDIVHSLYLGTVSSPKKQKQKVAHLGKIAAENIDRYKNVFKTDYGLRTDVTKCLNYSTDTRYKGLKRRLLAKNYPDIDAKIIVNQYFSPFPDYIFHLVEVPNPDEHEHSIIRVIESEIQQPADKPEWAVAMTQDIINRLEMADIMPHHPQYVEHNFGGLNFDIQLVKKHKKIYMVDATAIINRNWTE